ncbi:uncharacterized protein LOC113554436 [Rhopalosiphum maidis]|uniref:uncharacterized protein LOC113554436 n=1 Tax=Rhopalosiphum maidis TaxID=43146 RepID=UPI000EFF771B|nr:uncharacterized protein LOC113554436 [Rhopalosiphum maidis]
MRTSRICLILLSILVVQISSEDTELDKVINKITASMAKIAEKPYTDLLAEIRARPDVNNFLKDYSRKVNQVMEQTQKDLFNLIPQQEKNTIKRVIDYSSLSMSSAFWNTAKGVTSVTNTSFNTLPDDIKTKLLELGNDINDFLKKLKVANDNGLKKSK